MSKPPVLVMSNAIQSYICLSETDYAVSVLSDHLDRDAYLRTSGDIFAVVVTSGADRLDKARLDLLPNLRAIIAIAAGIAGIDLDEAKRRGIAVTNAGATNSGDVADHAIAMMLAVRRDLVAGDAYVRTGRWVEKRMPPGR
ncbi:MAG: hypothetical protein ABI395_10360, partial [Sphingobium sp.]